MSLSGIATGIRPPLLLLLLAGLGAAGCSSMGGQLGGETAPKAAMREHATPQQGLSPAEADKRLLALAINYRRIQDVDNERGCTIENAVEITAIAEVKLTRPALLTQDMAIRMGRWVKEVLQPAAQKNFGRQIASIEVYGSYSCRNIYGKPFGGRFAGRLSEHAFANAVDIGGFQLADGREVGYLKHWRKPDGSSRFLHATSLGACEIFNTTLTPDYDRFHRNHIHIDASPKKEETNKFCGFRGRFSPGAVPAFARYKAPGKKWRPRGKKQPVKKRVPAKKKKKPTTA